MRVETREFGRTESGQVVTCFSIFNSTGASVSLIDYGATLTCVRVADKNGVVGDVTLHFPEMKDYVEFGSAYLGSTVGRFANRIRNGSFQLEGQTVQVTRNLGAHHLHGGTVGWDKRVWAAEVLPCSEASREAGVVFRLVSEDGEEGYPGRVSCEATYWFTENNVLRFTFTATTDKATPVNICNHAYWSLNGAAGVGSQVLRSFCDRFLETDVDSVPTGSILPVAGTPLDFFSAPALVSVGYEGLKESHTKGMDHCLIVADSQKPDAAGLRDVLELHDPESGRVMTVRSTLPGIQVYSSNYLPGDLQRKYCCFETQQFPDAPNHPHFPSCILGAGQTVSHTTEHIFSVRA